jgi:hypothetical protein
MTDETAASSASPAVSDAVGMLPATWLAAFIINFGIGVTTIWRGGIDLTGIWIIDLLILITFLINISFFFYVEAYTEIDPFEQHRIQSTAIIEWYLRVINQVLLSVLWLLYEHSVGYFLAGFLLFYIILLIWDYVVCLPIWLDTGRLGIPPIVRYDFWGFVTSLIFVCLVLSERIHKGDAFHIVPAWVNSLIRAGDPQLVHGLAMWGTGVCTGVYVTILILTVRKMRRFGMRDFLGILITRSRLA